MTTPAIIVYPDALEAALGFLRSRPEMAGVTTASAIPSTTHKPLPFLWARRVGGTVTGRAVDRARLDFHVYHRSEKQAHDLTQLVRGLLAAWPDFDSTVVQAAREFTGPGPFPDDLWPNAFRFYFTYELSLRGYALPDPSL